MNELRFPLFVSLQGKKAVVIGGGHIGGKRGEKLAHFGAQVTVIDPEFHPLLQLKQITRPYEKGDLEGAYLCVAATKHPDLNRQIAQDAKALGVLVNVVDDPSLCDFFFPAICQSEDMVVGLVSDGTKHHQTAKLAKQIRGLLEEELSCTSK